jgi:hypothetical protein
LLRLISKAVEKPNTKCIVVCVHDGASRHTMRMAFEMITPLLGDGFVTVFHQRREIRFGNGSLISFYLPNQMSRTRGIRFNEAVIDNSMVNATSDERALTVGLLRDIVRD